RANWCSMTWPHSTPHHRHSGTDSGRFSPIGHHHPARNSIATPHQTPPGWATSPGRASRYGDRDMARRGNVLFITVDQWRGDSLAALGLPIVQTPALAGLAAEGVLFAQHNANIFPSGPSRASLYTGMYAQ